MIITLTCNPAIDKSIRNNITTYDVGGKGINVSKVLKSLDTASLATGFMGKANATIVLEKLKELEIDNHFIEVEGSVRTNTKRIIDNKLYEENEKGPLISDNDSLRLIEYLKQFKNDIVTISGSCTSNIYGQLVKVLKENNNYVILDADKELLRSGLKAKPDCIKPNKAEICRYFNCDYDEEKIIAKCKELNLDLICLSLGEEGAIFINKKEVYKAKPMIVDYHNPTGAGDAMVASLAYAKAHNYNFKQTIDLCMATSASMCETDGSAAPSKDLIIRKLTIREQMA